MLRQVINPGGGVVAFNYDPLGRRIAKQYKGIVTRWVWDGNVPLHEWKYEGGYPPQSSIDENGAITEIKEPVENLITWVFEDGSFVPCAKIENDNEYSIVADYLGTPTHAYNSTGQKVWEREIDCYGKVRKLDGEKDFCPYLYQGQHVDSETGLAYNRFRYYDNESGGYINQDPISIQGGLNLYAYVHDPNTWVDTMGLTPSPNLNTNGATGNFGLYEIKINGELHKIGKADLGRVTQSSNLPTRLHQQLRILREANPGKIITGKVVEDLGTTTTKGAKAAETARLQAHFDKTGEVLDGNKKSFKPKTGCY
jgi:RHS repeat-associated protein